MQHSLTAHGTAEDAEGGGQPYIQPTGRTYGVQAGRQAGRKEDVGDG